MRERDELNLVRLTVAGPWVATPMTDAGNGGHACRRKFTNGQPCLGGISKEQQNQKSIEPVAPREMRARVGQRQVYIRRMLRDLFQRLHQSVHNARVLEQKIDLRSVDLVDPIEDRVLVSSFAPDAGA